MSAPPPPPPPPPHHHHPAAAPPQGKVVPSTMLSALHAQIHALRGDDSESEDGRMGGGGEDPPRPPPAAFHVPASTPAFPQTQAFQAAKAASASAGPVPVKKPIFEVHKSIDKLREDVMDWSLADDAGLLCVLEEISNKLKTSMHDLEHSVDDLVYETHACHVSVRNTLTKFSMLSNKQFVENRVYEDDEGPLVGLVGAQQVTRQEKSVAQSADERQRVLVPKYTSAIYSSYQALRGRIRGMQVDEYVGGQGGLQQDTQNRYCVNALPHVIGTPEYVFSETVGLHRRREAGPPQEFSDSEEEEDWRAVAAQQNQATVLAVGGGTVFVGGGAAGQDDDWEQIPNISVPRAATAAHIGIEGQARPHQNVQQQQQQQQASDILGEDEGDPVFGGGFFGAPISRRPRTDLFGGGSTNSGVDADAFGDDIFGSGQEGSGLFGGFGGTSLLFGHAGKKEEKQEEISTQVQAVGGKAPVVVGQEVVQEARTAAAKTGLFDHGDNFQVVKDEKKKAALFDDDDDEFAPPVAKSEEKKRGGALFDDDEDDFGPPISYNDKKTAKKGGSSLLFGDDGDGFVLPVAKQTSSSSSAAESRDRGKSSLFGDDNDSLFGGAGSKKSANKTATATETNTAKSLHAETTAKATPAVHVAPPASQGAPQSAGALPSIGVESSKHAASLVGKGKSGKSLGLFGDDANDDLFGAATANSRAPATKPARKSAGGLFGDDDMADPFASTATKKAVAKKVTTSGSLFGDDDIDFTGGKISTQRASKPSSSALFDQDADVASKPDQKEAKTALIPTQAATTPIKKSTQEVEKYAEGGAHAHAHTAQQTAAAAPLALPSDPRPSTHSTLQTAQSAASRSGDQFLGDGGGGRDKIETRKPGGATIFDEDEDAHLGSKGEKGEQGGGNERQGPSVEGAEVGGRGSKQKDVGLVGDDDDRDNGGGLFDGAMKSPPKTVSAEKGVVKSRSGSLFRDDDDDDTDGPFPRRSTKIAAKSSLHSGKNGLPSQSLGVGLFEGSDGTTKKSENSAHLHDQQRTPAQSAGGGLFSDDDADLFGEKKDMPLSAGVAKKGALISSVGNAVSAKRDATQESFASLGKAVSANQDSKKEDPAILLDGADSTHLLDGKSKPGKIVSGIGASLNFNPASLMPGAKAPVHKHAGEHVDEAASSNDAGAGGNAVPRTKGLLGGGMGMSDQLRSDLASKIRKPALESSELQNGGRGDAVSSPHTAAEEVLGGTEGALEHQTAARPKMAGRKRPTMKSAASTAPTPATVVDVQERQIDRSPAVPSTIQSEVISPEVTAAPELKREAPEKKGAEVQGEGNGSKLKASLFADDSDDDLFDSPAASIRKSGGGGAKSIFE